MSGRRRSRREPDALVITKRLVAHVDALQEHSGVPWGPADGDVVGVPAPCARLIAGYWCACGSGFASVGTREETFRARVTTAPDGVWRGFVDDGFDGERWLEQTVHRPDEADRLALQRAVEALELGTVVERHGVGVAPAFDWTSAAVQPWTGPSRRAEEAR